MELYLLLSTSNQESIGSNRYALIFTQDNIAHGSLLGLVSF